MHPQTPSYSFYCLICVNKNSYQTHTHTKKEQEEEKKPEALLAYVLDNLTPKVGTLLYFFKMISGTPLPPQIAKFSCIYLEE